LYFTEILSIIDSVQSNHRYCYIGLDSWWYQDLVIW